MLRTQTLDYLGVPFRCTRCRQTGHLRRDCKGFIWTTHHQNLKCYRIPTSTDPPEVSSGGWNVLIPEEVSPEEDSSDTCFTSKLKTLCPSLYFSLSSWERLSLDQSLGRDFTPAPSDSPVISPELEPLPDLFPCKRLSTGGGGGGSHRYKEKSIPLCIPLAFYKGSLGEHSGCFEHTICSKDVQGWILFRLGWGEGQCLTLWM
jgi:hypothetical protein